jgi:hypothetical protein
MTLVRVAILNRSLREIMPPTWKYFWTEIPNFSVYAVYGLFRERAKNLGCTAKYADARYTWRDLDAFPHKFKHFFF